MTKQKKSHQMLQDKPEARVMPTSPHLQIYRWNISSITSILHRLTGVVLFFSLLIVAWYIVYYAYNTKLLTEQEHCECLTMKLIKCVLMAAVVGVVFSLYYHFCNGIRHLFWDIGKGFELKTAKKTGYLSLLLALLLTAASFAATYYFKLF